MVVNYYTPAFAKLYIFYFMQTFNTFKELEVHIDKVVVPEKVIKKERGNICHTLKCLV